MTSAEDRNDRLTTQKEEWVTPQISLMEVGVTASKGVPSQAEYPRLSENDLGS